MQNNWDRNLYVLYAKHICEVVTSQRLGVIDIRRQSKLFSRIYIPYAYNKTLDRN